MVRWTSGLWLGVLMLGAAGWGSCGDTSDSCKSPKNNFVCSVDLKPSEGCGDACGLRDHDLTEICALDAAEAAAQTGPYWAQRGYVATVTSFGCWRPNLATVLAEDPPFTAQDFATCDADSTDNSCVSCAKGACCAEYQACVGDPVCLCWVACKHSGNPDSACALPANCGPLNATSSAADACLDANCSPQCNGTASMGGSCACAGSGNQPPPPQPTCTPGPFGSGQPCFSDGDCATCSCSTWTMTCD